LLLPDGGKVFIILLFMERFNRSLKLFGIGVLIVLATLGVGIGGGAPVLPNRKKESTNEVRTELVEVKEDETKKKEEEDLKP
jgi:hypothetical protein